MRTLATTLAIIGIVLLALLVTISSSASAAASSGGRNNKNKKNKNGSGNPLSSLHRHRDDSLPPSFFFLPPRQSKTGGANHNAGRHAAAAAAPLSERSLRAYANQSSLLRGRQGWRAMKERRAKGDSASSSSSFSSRKTPFRPPAYPLIAFSPLQQKFLFGDNPAAAATTYWDGNEMPVVVLLSVAGQRFVLVGNTTDLQEQLEQREEGSGSLLVAAPPLGLGYVGPLKTTFEYSLNTSSFGALTVELSFVQPKLPDDLDILSRPATYIQCTIRGASTTTASTTTTTTTTLAARLFVGVSALNTVSLPLLSKRAQPVTWETSPRAEMGTPTGAAWSIKIGTVQQPVLSGSGDDWMLNWGYAHLAAPTADASSQFVGGGFDILQQFVQTGALPASSELKPPQAPEYKTQFQLGIAGTTDLVPSSSGEYSAYLVFAYDSIAVQYFFGDVVMPRYYPAPFQHGVLDMAVRQASALLQACDDFETSFFSYIVDNQSLSLNYANLAAVAYKQAFAGIDCGIFTSASKRFAGEEVCFLKEISSDGDVSTMDVIFPASPVFFATNPVIVEKLLLPVLWFGANMTWHNFTQPFSPHQLGFWPISNITTSEEEVMPLENSGNMLLMIHKLLQHGSGFRLLPFYSLLEGWVEAIFSTNQLPSPPEQIYTDDFNGPLTNCTNLAAKGNVAVRAFADICEYVSSSSYSSSSSSTHPSSLKSKRPCSYYRTKSLEFAEYWVKHSIATDNNGPHSLLAFGLGNSTFSSKYNLLWQRLLKLGNEPYANYSSLCQMEVDYYQRRSNRYGQPLDQRHQWQKIDWATWSAALAPSKKQFLAMFEVGPFQMANTTASRWPLTDLYSTLTGDIAWLGLSAFRSRPVVGALFAPLLIDDWQP